MDNKTPLNMEDIDNNPEVLDIEDELLDEIPDNDTSKGNIILIVIIIVLSIIITVGTIYIVINSQPKDQISSISK